MVYTKRLIACLPAVLMLITALPSCCGDGDIHGPEPFDQLAPLTVNDLAVAAVSNSSITLTWTASGDNRDVGTATSYDLRYDTASFDPVQDPLKETWFSEAVQVEGLPAPQSAGNAEVFEVTGLQPGVTYFFALRVADELEQTSGVSNLASGTTTGGTE